MTNQDIWIWNDSSSYSIVNIPGYTDLSALFDEIMVDRVDITMIAGPDPGTGGAGSNAFGGAQLIFAKDYNDKVKPSAAADVQQYSDCRIFSMTNNYTNKMVWKPRFLTYAFDSSSQPLATTPKRGFIRSTSSIEHYGIKGSFVNLSSVDQIHQYFFKVTFRCKVTK